MHIVKERFSRTTALAVRDGKYKKNWLSEIKTKVGIPAILFETTPGRAEQRGVTVGKTFTKTAQEAGSKGRVHMTQCSTRSDERLTRVTIDAGSTDEMNPEMDNQESTAARLDSVV